MKTKEAMINELVDELDCWEYDDIMDWVKELERRRLRARSEEEVREEYYGVFAEDE